MYKPMKQRRCKPIAERFWPKVEVSGPDECWLWLANRSYSGYGYIGAGRAGEGQLAAHRVSYELAYGPIPKGCFVLHHCDTKLCVNPKHLFVGTQADNIADMDRKGRRVVLFLTGENHPNAKLTEAKVREIRESPESLRTLAEKFGVSRTLIKAARVRKIWRHI